MVVVLAVVAVLVTGWWVTRTVRSARLVGHSPQPELTAYIARADAIGYLLRVVGVLIACGIWITSTPDSPVRSPLSATATLVAAPILLAILILGDRRWPSPTGTIRTASLVPRRLRDTVPAAELVLASIATLALWATSALGGAPDVTTSVGTPIISDALSLVCIGLAAIAVRRVTTRAALIGVDAAADLAFRRLACGRVLRTLAICFFLTAAGFQVLVPNSSGLHPGVISTSLLVGAVISSFALQGRQPRTRSSIPSVAAGQRS